MDEETRFIIVVNSKRLIIFPILGYVNTEQAMGRDSWEINNRWGKSLDMQ